jgi:glycosyltransferase involved in cell wall biosynthesis
MKLCVITCYDQPDYIRAITLRAASSRLEGVDLVVVKNTRTGILRYAEVFLKMAAIRLRSRPDAYLLTFRGYEMLLPVRLLSLGKPLIYDEFINPIEWVVKEKRRVRAKNGSGRLYVATVRLVSRIIAAVVASSAFKYLYRKLLQSVDVVLTDSSSHAGVSAKLTGLDPDKFFVVPVGTDETVFAEGGSRKHDKDDSFTVLYYGNMLPLHGLSHVIDAATKMSEDSVRFVLVGGNSQVVDDVASAIKKGAKIEYKSWVDFDKLPGLMQSADLCLAGPFGDTFQSRYVITGKAYQFLAMGRPTVIGANLESDVFTDKVNALVVEQGSSKALVEAIRWAMANEKKLHEIGIAGRDLYSSRYSNEALAGRMRELLARVGPSQP